MTGRLFVVYLNGNIHVNRTIQGPVNQYNRGDDIDIRIAGLPPQEVDLVN